jgi:hypothetical protein
MRPGAGHLQEYKGKIPVMSVLLCLFSGDLSLTGSNEIYLFGSISMVQNLNQKPAGSPGFFPAETIENHLRLPSVPADCRNQKGMIKRAKILSLCIIQRHLLPFF